MSDVVVIDKDKFRYMCPHCKLWTEVLQRELNCKIFRHAVYEKDLQPINPHASEEEVKAIRSQIIGCGGPHRLFQSHDGTWKVGECSWAV
jgi:hypothetical protein